MVISSFLFAVNRNKHMEGHIVFIREGFVVKRFVDIGVNISETIFVEVTVSKKKWCLLFLYRPA